MTTHTCHCGKVYDCWWCFTQASYACPTLNDDEDANTCPECLIRIADEMQAVYDEGSSERTQT